MADCNRSSRREVTYAFGHWLVATLILGASLLGAASALAQPPDCTKLDVNANVVELSLNGRDRIGSGVLLTFDGHLITAAHLLNDVNDPRRLMAHVRLHGERKYHPARILRVDDRLDLALLRIEVPVPDFQPITAAVESDVRQGQSAMLCLSGFPIHKSAVGARVEENFSSVATDYAGDRLGYLFSSWPAEDGFSGGAAFLKSSLVGMILRRKTPSGTFILPISYIEAMVDEGGVEIGADRVFEPGIPASQMNQKITNNRRLIEANRRDIALVYRSMNWAVDLSGRGSPDLALVLTPRRALPAQVADGTLFGTLFVYFDSDAFRRYLGTNKPLGVEIGAEIPKDGTVVIGNLMERINTLRAKYLVDHGINLKGARPHRLKVDARIYAYAGTSKLEVSTIDDEIALDGGVEDSQ